MSNLSDIGFPVQNDQDVNDMIMNVLNHARAIPCSSGFYLKFSDDSGAEIYLQGNKDQDLIGFNPHFAGKSKRTVGLTQAIERDSSELDGGFHAWADPDKRKIVDSGEYPFVFDVPDFRTVGKIDFPKLCNIQLTAFASNDFKVFENEEDFFGSQDDETKMAARSFIPSGLFSLDESEETDISLARPIGIFAGEIKDFELKTNLFSNENFYWFLIDTLGGEVDIVADPKLVPVEPRIGGIVSGQFWLSGQIID